MIWLAAASLLAWLYLTFLHASFWQIGPSLAPAEPRVAPSVTVVVPARDEAALVRQSVGSLLAQEYAGSLRVVLVDDGSRDGTGDVARRFGDPRLTVLTGSPRPPGWAGKLWAVNQGVAASEADWLLLTDADIVHEPSHLATLMAQAERIDADLVSEMVALRCESFAERSLIPAFVYFFQLLYPFARVNDPRSPVAAAAGGTILIRATALQRIGGIAAIRGALIDDVALAAAVKPGGRVWLGHSRLARSVRPYPHLADIWRMVARSAYVQLRHSPWLLLGSVACLLLMFLGPIAATLFGHGLARMTAIAAWMLMAASFMPTLQRFRLWPPRSITLPLAAVFYIAATIGSAIDHHRGRGVVWKQRSYPAGTT